MTSKIGMSSMSALVPRVIARREDHSIGRPLGIPLVAFAVAVGLVIAGCAPSAQPAPAAPVAAAPRSAAVAGTAGAPGVAAPVATVSPAVRKLTIANSSLSLAIPFFVARDQGMFVRQ